jgi:hypothetical protein
MSCATNSIGMKLRLIPPGEFDVGATAELVEEHLKATPVESSRNTPSPGEASGVAQADV